MLTFADDSAKVALSPQLFKDPECWSGQESNLGQLLHSLVLNQFS